MREGRNVGVPNYVSGAANGRHGIDVYSFGSAYLGNDTHPFIVPGDPSEESFQVKNLALDNSLSDRLDNRTELLRGIDRFRAHAERDDTMNAIDSFQRQAIELLSSSRTRGAFDLSHEDLSTRHRYGDTHWGRSLLTCRRLVEAGVRFVQCQATFRLKPETGRTSNWDDHSVNADIFKAYRERMPVFDQCVPALINDLQERGLDKNVLFIFCGEFGRTPLIRHQDKATKRPGRDHWSKAMSIFLAGGGLKMGQYIGATNAKGEHPVDRIMDSNCLLATLYHKFGIDFHKHYFDNSGRPIPILTDGEPISELL